MKTKKMGGTQSTRTRWALAAAVTRTLPDSDNYFTQRLSKWAAENSQWAPPAEITIGDDDDDDDHNKDGGDDEDDDVRVIAVIPPPTSPGGGDGSFTEPRQRKSKMKFQRDRSVMSPYYRPNKDFLTRDSYLELLQRYVVTYNTDKVSGKHKQLKRLNSSNHRVSSNSPKYPISRFSLLEHELKKNQKKTEEVIEIKDDDEDVYEEKEKNESTRDGLLSGNDEWFAGFRKELNDLEVQRTKETDISEKAFQNIFEKRKQLIREPAEPAEVPPQTPPLDEKMLKRIRDALNRSNAQDILVTAFKLAITRSDLDTLKGLTWLNDSIINFYLNLIASRSEKFKAKLPSVYTFNTFFYTRLSQEGHKGVRRWTRREDIFSYDILLVPVHLGMHWCLAVIDFRKKSVDYYDSMGGNNDRCTAALLRYLQDESQDKKQAALDVSGWVCNNLKDLPLQGNGSDCGMFACKYAEYVTRDARINFSQKDMPYFRNRMIYEILQAELL